MRCIERSTARAARESRCHSGRSTRASWWPVRRLTQLAGGAPLPGRAPRPARLQERHRRDRRARLCRACRRPVGREEEVRVTGVRQTISVDELVTSATLDHEGLGTFDSPLVVVDLASAPEVPAAAVEALRRSRVSSSVSERRPRRAPWERHSMWSHPIRPSSTRSSRWSRSMPRAAVALVLLLRGRDGRSLEDASVAESMTYSMLQAGAEFASGSSVRSTAGRRRMRRHRFAGKSTETCCGSR